jgi:hypothetical protein
MKINAKKILPDDTSTFNGFPIVRILTVLFLLLVVVRSCIHLFAEDGGANSIAGIDISIAGGENIVAIFHQWGAIQLLLASLLVLLFFRYPGLTPLTLLALALDPVLRSIAGAIAPITVEGTPPGESLNWPAFILVFALFLASLLEKGRKKS